MRSVRDRARFGRDARAHSTTPASLDADNRRVRCNRRGRSLPTGRDAVAALNVNDSGPAFLVPFSVRPHLVARLIDGRKITGIAARRLFASQLRINMVSAAAAAVMGTLVLAIGYPVYLHFLGYEQYGVWLVLATVLTSVQLGNFALGSAVVKLVAEEYGRGDVPGVQSYIATAFVLLCVSGMAVLTVILVFRRPIIALFAMSSENAQTALRLLPYVGILSVYVLIVQVFEAALSGLGRMDLANYRGLLARITNLCVSVGLLYSGSGIRSLLIGRTVAELITHLAVFLCIRRMVHVRILPFDISRCRRIVCFGGTVLGTSLLNMLLRTLNTLILSRYVGVASIPVYDMAFTGSMQIRGLVAAGHAAIIPEISRLSGERTLQARARILALSRRSLELILLLGAPLYMAIGILAPLLLRFWLGDRFVDTLPGAFRIMLLGTFTNVLGTPAYYTLIGMGHVRHGLMASIVQALTNLMVILCVLVMLHTTVSAVAWSSSIAMAVATTYLVLKKRCVLSSPAVS